MTVPEPAASSPGSPVRVVAQKWGGRPHWEFDALLLGSDAHGLWVGVEPGTRITRPGRLVVAGQPQVVLFPPDEGYVATFYAADPPADVRVYVDLTTIPRVEAGVVTSVDLDLDVVQRHDGSVYVDDEDEFVEHSAAWGYPDELVAATRALCDRLVAEVGAGRPPFDAVHMTWLERLGGLRA